jgi:hypothetical protein
MQEIKGNQAVQGGQGCDETSGFASSTSTSVPSGQSVSTLHEPSALNGIASTWFHDEGAYARCSDCGRYSLDSNTITQQATIRCECGSTTGWSGSFKKPSPDAKWSGAAPHGSVRRFVLPTKPLSIIDAINRMALATGNFRNACASSDANFNGHPVEVRWNDYRGYWVAQYHWCDRIVIARGELGPCLIAAKDFYATQGRGASVTVHVESPDDAYICKACDFIPAAEEDTSWRDWKFEEVNHALDMERRGFGAYTAHLIAATSREDYDARKRTEVRPPIAFALGFQLARA